MLSRQPGRVKLHSLSNLHHTCSWRCFSHHLL